MRISAMGYVVRFTPVICMGYCFAPAGGKAQTNSAGVNIKKGSSLSHFDFLPSSAAGPQVSQLSIQFSP